VSPERIDREIAPAGYDPYNHNPFAEPMTAILKVFTNDRIMWLATDGYVRRITNPVVGSIEPQ
jgi:hypothetical protein